MNSPVNNVFANMYMGIASKSRIFTQKFRMLYEMGSTPRGLQKMRHISKRDLKTILATDFRIELNHLSSAQRIVLYRKLRRVLMSYNEYGKTSVLSMWKNVSLELTQLATSDLFVSACRSQNRNASSPVSSCSVISSASACEEDNISIVQIDLSDDDDDNDECLIPSEDTSEVRGLISSTPCKPPTSGLDLIMTMDASVEVNNATSNESPPIVEVNPKNQTTIPKGMKPQINLNAIDLNTCEYLTMDKVTSPTVSKKLVQPPPHLNETNADVNNTPIIIVPTTSTELTEQDILTVGAILEKAKLTESVSTSAPSVRRDSIPSNCAKTKSQPVKNTVDQKRVNPVKILPKPTPEKCPPADNDILEKTPPQSKLVQRTSTPKPDEIIKPTSVEPIVKKIRPNDPRIAASYSVAKPSIVNKMVPTIMDGASTNASNLSNGAIGSKDGPDKMSKQNRLSTATSDIRPHDQQTSPHKNVAAITDIDTSSRRSGKRKKKSKSMSSSRRSSCEDSIDTAHSVDMNTSVDIKRSADMSLQVICCFEFRAKKHILMTFYINQIVCPPDQLKCIQMDLVEPNHIRLNFSPIHRHAAENISCSQPIFIKHLLNWPGITLHLNMGKVRLTRSTVPNYTRALIVGGHTLRDAIGAPNHLDMRRIVTESMLPRPELSIEMLNTFFTMTQSVELPSFTSNRKFPFKVLFKTIASELHPMRTILLNQQYTYFLNNTQYGHYYSNSADRRVPTRHRFASDAQMVRMLEIINPEVRIEITACPFVLGNDEDVDSWTQDTFDYFARLTSARCPEALIEFNEMLRNAFAFECTVCDVQFDDGNNAMRDVTRHIRKVHCASTDWNCAYCELTEDTLKLAENCWIHTCG